MCDNKNAQSFYCTLKVRIYKNAIDMYLFYIYEYFMSENVL